LYTWGEVKDTGIGTKKDGAARAAVSSHLVLVSCLLALVSEEEGSVLFLWWYGDARQERYQTRYHDPPFGKKEFRIQTKIAVLVW
jgi:hypothetical protein